MEEVHETVGSTVLLLCVFCVKRGVLLRELRVEMGTDVWKGGFVGQTEGECERGSSILLVEQKVVRLMFVSFLFR